MIAAADETCGGVVVNQTSDHGTVLATCPATGPTVAPTSEGHYYYTSTLGEKWVWIYGDSEPFVIGKRYGNINATSTGTMPLLAVNPMTLPRNGFITITAWQTGDNTTVPVNSAVRTGIALNGTEINASRDNGQNATGGNRHGQAVVTRVAVVVGDVISANYSAAAGTGTVTGSHLRYQYDV